MKSSYHVYTTTTTTTTTATTTTATPPPGCLHISSQVFPSKYDVILIKKLLWGRELIMIFCRKNVGNTVGRRGRGGGGGRRRGGRRGGGGGKERRERKEGNEVEKGLRTYQK